MIDPGAHRVDPPPIDPGAPPPEPPIDDSITYREACAARDRAAAAAELARVAAAARDAARPLPPEPPTPAQRRAARDAELRDQARRDAERTLSPSEQLLVAIGKLTDAIGGTR